MEIEAYVAALKQLSPYEVLHEAEKLARRLDNWQPGTVGVDLAKKQAAAESVTATATAGGNV